MGVKCAKFQESAVHFCWIGFFPKYQRPVFRSYTILVNNLNKNGGTYSEEINNEEFSILNVCPIRQN